MKGIKGEIINSRYEIIKKLGEGGFGRVFKVRQISMNRDAVIKTTIHKPDLDSNFKERFFLEAIAVSRLKHPNIITYYDFGQDEDGDYFLVMELLDGKSLTQIIKNESPLPLGRIIYITTQIASALHEAHINGIVHRDVKPNNIFIIKSGEDPDFVKLIDFGILAIKTISSQSHHTLDLEAISSLTKSGILLGTPEYMAPEMITGQGFDFRADQYALGLILYELLTGYKPFEADSQIEMMIKHVKENPVEFSKRPHGRNIPVAIERVVMKSLNKLPEGRFESMLEFRYHLLRAARLIVTKESFEKTESCDLGDVLARIDKRSTIKEMSDKHVPITPVKKKGKNLSLYMVFSCIFLVIAVVSLYFILSSDKNNNHTTYPIPHTPYPILHTQILFHISDRRGPDTLKEIEQISRSQEKNIAVDKGTGILSLNVFPWADVKLNGKNIGKTPIKDIKIPAGKCTLILEHPDYESKKISFTVKKGEEIKKYVDMRK